MRLPVYHKFLARHGNVKAHIEYAPLMFVLVWNLDYDPASHDVGIKRFKLFRFLPNMALQCFRMGNIACSDLQLQFHFCVLSMIHIMQLTRETLVRMISWSKSYVFADPYPLRRT